MAPATIIHLWPGQNGEEMFGRYILDAFTGNDDSVTVQKKLLTRRMFLSGLGVAAGAGYLSSNILLANRALAAGTTQPPEIDIEGVEAEDAQFVDEFFDDGRRRRRGRRRDRDDRRHRRRRRRRQRYSRRELLRRCQFDWRFRNQNRRLCDRVIRGPIGRRGACIDLFGLLICE
jgi:hypothetical protein